MALAAHGVSFAIGVLGAMAMAVSMRSISLDVAGSSVSNATGAAFFLALGTSFLGTAVLRLAPGFVAWLGTKDARAQAPKAESRTGPESV